MTLQPCVNLRTLGYHTTGVQRYLRSLLPYMPSELDSVKPPRALQGIKGHLWEQLYLPSQLRRRLLWSPGNTGPITVSNTGGGMLTISGLDFSRGATDFSVSGLPANFDANHPVVLAPGQTLALDVTFDPDSKPSRTSETPIITARSTRGR